MSMIGVSTSATIIRHLKLRRNDKFKSTATVLCVAIRVEFATYSSYVHLLSCEIAAILPFSGQILRFRALYLLLQSSLSKFCPSLLP